MEVSRGEGGRARELGLRGGIGTRMGKGVKPAEGADPLSVQQMCPLRGRVEGRALGVVIGVPGDGAQ